jgi:hypothetical protein
MKTTILATLLCLILYPASSFCQLQIGAKGGIDIAKYVDEKNLMPDAKWTSLNGVIVGGIARYAISDMFSLQFEANYTQKGLTFNTSFSDGTERLNYLEFPLGLLIKFMSSDIRPYLYIGGGIGLLLSAKVEGKASGQPVILDTKVNYYSTDLTAQLGAGLEYVINPSISIFADARYTPGLFTIEKVSDGTVKTSGIQVQLGIMKSID